MDTNMTNELKESFKPMLNMLDIQNRTAQKMMREQMNFMSECLELSSQQSDSLRDSDDQTRFFRVPLDAGREIGERWNKAMTRQWNILVEARDEMTGEAQSLAKNAESAAKKASQEAESTVRQASENVNKAASDATSRAESSADSETTGKTAASDTSSDTSSKAGSSTSKETKSSSSSNRKSQS